MAVTQPDLVTAVTDVVQAQKAAVAASGVQATRQAQWQAATVTYSAAIAAVDQTQRHLLDLIAQFAAQ